MLVNCEQCGIEFKKPRCHIERVKHIFCSKPCANLFQTQYPSKICIVCGNPFKVARGNQDRYVTCSDDSCRSQNKSKNRNPNWRGGTYSQKRARNAAMSTRRYKLWRLSVFERDKFTCQMCGQHGGDLCADHIKPWAYFPDFRYELSNGRTLCVPCHKTTYKAVFQWRA